MHVLVSVLVPPPQVAEQAPVTQADQPPSTRMYGPILPISQVLETFSTRAWVGIAGEGPGCVPCAVGASVGGSRIGAGPAVTPAAPAAGGRAGAVGPIGPAAVLKFA